MGREYEIKFRATEAQLSALAGLYPDAAVIAMETTYYDTPDGGLSARRWTLRRRLENGVSVCTLKTPTGTAARNEWEVGCDGIADAVPLLCAAGAPAELLTLAADAEPLCGARFTRRAVRIALGEAELELAMDEGVLMGGGRQIPLREIEVELKSGREADAQSYAGLLQLQLGLEIEEKSKFRRAKDLAEGEKYGI